MSKDHYVPQSILRGFATAEDGEQIWVFNKERGATFRSAIRDAGSENHFNRIVIDGQPVSFENAFQDADHRLPLYVKTLRESRSLGSLSDSDCTDIAALAVIQLLRVKHVRESVQALPAQLAAFIKDLKLDVPAEIAQGIDEHRAKIISLQLLSDIQPLANALLQKDWALLFTEGGRPFWTSDNPVVGKQLFASGGVGLESRGARFIWPLAKDLALQFSCPTIAEKVAETNPQFGRQLRTRQTFIPGDDFVRAANRLQVVHATQFVYGPTNDFADARELCVTHPQLKDRRGNVMRTGQSPSTMSKALGPGIWLSAFGQRTHYLCKLDDITEGGSFMTPMHATVAESSAAEMEKMLADGPFSNVEIKSDNGGSGMQYVAIARGDGLRKITISHDWEQVKSSAQARRDNK